MSAIGEKAGPPVHKTEYFDYVRVSELPNFEAGVFERWLSGQTRPIVEGIDPQDAAYAWDYERWCDEGKRLEQRLAGWD